MSSRLKRFLAVRGKSAYWLQKETGLAYNTIYRLMRSDNVGTIDTWRRIAEALGCKVDDIINFGEGDSDDGRKGR